MVAEQKRFCLLLAAGDSEFVKRVYGGYFNVFISAFGEEGEKWDLFRVVNGEFPEDDELDKYDGFVISGSSHDAHGDDEWILKLCSLCQTLDAMKKKVLGICFGHQIVCRAKGGKVGRARRGLDLGLTKVTLVKELASQRSFLGDEVPSSLSIIKCHQDEVLELPEEALVIAFSDKYDVEMYVIGDHILGIQGHPEYTKDIVFDLTDRALAGNIINEEIAENGKKSLETGEPDRKCWEIICRNFLNGRRESIIGIPSKEDANQSPEFPQEKDAN